MKTLITILALVTGMTMNSQDKNQRQMLEDKQEIKELQFKYAQALDKQEWEKLDSVFDKTFTVDFSKWGVPVSEMTIKDFKSFMKKTFSTDGLQTQHTMSNFLIELNGETAQSETPVN